MDRSYSRRFTLLEKAVMGENIRTGGSFITEIRSGKGTFIINLQGFSHLEDTILFLITSNELRSVGIPITYDKPDKNDTVRQKIIFDPDNVLDTGFRIEEFNLVSLIAKKGINGPNIIPVLTGYFDGKVNWKDNFIQYKTLISQRNQQKNNIIHNVIDNIKDITKEIKTEPLKNLEFLKFDDKKEDTQKVAEIIPEENTIEVASDECAVLEEVEESGFDFSVNPHETFKEISKKFRKQLEDLENQGIISSEEVTTIENTYTNKVNNTQSIESKIDDMYMEPNDTIKGDVSLTNKIVSEEEISDIEALFNKAEKIVPFSTNRNVTWVKVRPCHLILVPNIDWTIINDPFTFIGQKQFGHIILGTYNFNGEQLYYVGIPARYNNKSNKTANMYFSAYEDRPVREVKTICASLPS